MNSGITAAPASRGVFFLRLFKSVLETFQGAVRSLEVTASLGTMLEAPSCTRTLATSASIWRGKLGAVD